MYMAFHMKLQRLQAQITGDFENVPEWSGWALCLPQKRKNFISLSCDCSKSFFAASFCTAQTDYHQNWSKWSHGFHVLWHNIHDLRDEKSWTSWYGAKQDKSVRFLWNNQLQGCCCTVDSSLENCLKNAVIYTYICAKLMSRFSCAKVHNLLPCTTYMLAFASATHLQRDRNKCNLPSCPHMKRRMTIKLTLLVSTTYINTCTMSKNKSPQHQKNMLKRTINAVMSRELVRTSPAMIACKESCAVVLAPGVVLLPSSLLVTGTGSEAFQSQANLEGLLLAHFSTVCVRQKPWAWQQKWDSYQNTIVPSRISRCKSLAFCTRRPGLGCIHYLFSDAGIFFCNPKKYGSVTMACARKSTVNLHAENKVSNCQLWAVNWLTNACCFICFLFFRHDLLFDNWLMGCCNRLSQSVTQSMYCTLLRFDFCLLRACEMSRPRHLTRENHFHSMTKFYLFSFWDMAGMMICCGREQEQQCSRSTSHSLPHLPNHADYRPETQIPTQRILWLA